jgi:hypothetical protein
MAKNTKPTILFSNAAAAANGATAAWRGGKGVVLFEGTPSGTTLTLQFASPRGTWLTVAGISMTAAGASAAFDLPPGNIRGVLSSGTPSGVYVYVQPTGAD